MFVMTGSLCSSHTEVLVDLELVIMLEVCCNCLHAMKDACIPNRRCNRIGLGECAFASLQVLKSKPFNICREVPELTQTPVRMSVKCANKAGMMKLVCSSAKPAIFESGLKLTPDVITTPKPITENIEKLLDNGKGVLSAIEGISIVHYIDPKKNSQFTTLHHVCDYEAEPVTTERQKDLSLVKDPPHLLRQIVLHIFPPISTWCIIWIGLQE